MSDEETIQNRLIELEQEIRVLVAEVRQLQIKAHQGHTYINEPAPDSVVNLFEGNKYIEAARRLLANQQKDNDK